MNTVVTVNLGGNAYQVDEAGLAKLRAYLDAAQMSLAENPDKAEIINDIEVAIGEKCRTYLGPNKTVLEEKDIQEILTEMGPVAGDNSKTGASESGSNTEKDAKNPKHLYRIKEGSMVSGVCMGLAAYFDIDVTIVRIIFVILVFLTSGAWIAAYFIMAMILPVANTPQERAAASGVPPFTAQGIIDQARSGYENLKNSKEWRQWRHSMKQQAHQWKHDWKQQKYAQKAAWQNYQRNPFAEVLHSILGLIWTAFIIFCFWFGYHHIPFIHDFLVMIGNLLERSLLWVQQKIGY